MSDTTNKIAVRAVMYRERGRWCLRIDAPDWVAREVMTDHAQGLRPDIVSRDVRLGSGEHTLVVMFGTPGTD